MAKYQFRVFNPERQLVFENPNDLGDIRDVVAEARLVARYMESRNDTRYDGWTVDVFGPSGTLIMSLPWHFACQRPRLSGATRPPDETYASYPAGPQTHDTPAWNNVRERTA